MLHRSSLFLLTLLALALSPGSAHATATVVTGPDIARYIAISDQEVPDSPCAGQGAIVLDTAVPVGSAGHALVYPQADGSYGAVGCDVSVSPTWWASASGRHRCELVVHERWHKAGRQHTPTGVMSETGGYYPPCARTLRERITGSVEALSPPASIVRCGAWQGRVLPCRVTTFRKINDSTYMQTGERRYRARVRGEAFAIQRVQIRTVRSRRIR